MRLAAALVVVAFAACTRGSAPAATPAPVRPPLPHDVAGQIRQVIDAWRTAYEHRDADALAALYTHDADTAVVADGVPLIGWASVEPALRDRVGAAKEVHIRLKEVQVAALGDGAAYGIATITRDAGDATTTVHELGTITLVFARTDQGWRIASEHYSYRRAQ